MSGLFSDAGLRALREFIAQPLLCLFDFDGTLAPLAPDPDAVQLPVGVREQLLALQQRVPVGIVTGRALVDARPRLGFRPDYLIGNHGLEGVPGLPPAGEMAAIVDRWKSQLAGPLRSLGAGLWLEDKRYSLSVHYLHARDPESVAPELAALLAQLEPSPRLIAGKYILSALPADAGDKGRAVLSLLASAPGSGALYVGDDVTDEDVFRLAHPRIFPVRVGHDQPSAARWRLADDREVQHLLGWLVDALPAARRGGDHGTGLSR